MRSSRRAKPPSHGGRSSLAPARGLAPGASVLWRLSRPRADAFATSVMPRACWQGCGLALAAAVPTKSNLAFMRVAHRAMVGNVTQHARVTVADKRRAAAKRKKAKGRGRGAPLLDAVRDEGAPLGTERVRHAARLGFLSAFQRRLLLDRPWPRLPGRHRFGRLRRPHLRQARGIRSRVSDDRGPAVLGDRGVSFERHQRTDPNDGECCNGGHWRPRVAGLMSGDWHGKLSFKKGCSRCERRRMRRSARVDRFVINATIQFEFERVRKPLADNRALSDGKPGHERSPTHYTTDAGEPTVRRQHPLRRRVGVRRAEETPERAQAWSILLAAGAIDITGVQSLAARFQRLQAMEVENAQLKEDNANLKQTSELAKSLGLESSAKLKTLALAMSRASQLDPNDPPALLKRALDVLDKLGTTTAPEDVRPLSEMKAAAEANAKVASLETEKDKLQREVKNLMRTGNGLTYPSCWTKASGQSEYIFDITFLDSGISVRDATPERARDSAWGLVSTFPRQKVINEKTFMDATSRLFAWSKEQNCRFYTINRDATGPSNKQQYVRLRQTIENNFYPLYLKPQNTNAPLLVTPPAPKSE